MTGATAAVLAAPRPCDYVNPKTFQRPAMENIWTFYSLRKILETSTLRRSATRRLWTRRLWPPAVGPADPLVSVPVDFDRDDD